MGRNLNVKQIKPSGNDLDILTISGDTVSWVPISGTSAGVGLLPLEFRFNTNTTESDPSSGRFRFNQTSFSSVTEMYVSNQTVRGLDVGNIFSALTSGATIYVQQKNDSSRFGLFNIESLTDNTTWSKFGLSFVSGSNNMLVNNKNCVFLLYELGGIINVSQLNDLSDVDVSSLLPYTSTTLSDDGKLLYFDKENNNFTVSDNVTNGTSVINSKTFSSTTIDVGTPVYIVNYDNDLHQVEKANASSVSTMPCIGLAAEALDNTNSKHVMTFGKLQNVDLSTGSTINNNNEIWEINDALYVDVVDGSLTKNRPSGASTQIQRIAKILKTGATGQLLVFNTARTAGLPNLTNNFLWVGNTDNQPIEYPLGNLTADTSFWSAGTGTDSIVINNYNPNNTSGNFSINAALSSYTSGNNSVAIGGTNNGVNGDRSGVIFGSFNTIETLSTNSVVIGGTINTIYSANTNSSIVGGNNNDLTANNSVILGGNNINGTDDNTAYVPNLNIGNSLVVTVYTANTANITPDEKVIIGVRDTSSAVTITIQSVDISEGRIFIIKDESGGAGTNNITIQTQGSENIDGSSSIIINSNYGVSRFYVGSDGNLYTW